MEQSADIDYQRKTKCTQYWISIRSTWEDICGMQYLALLERSLRLSWWSHCLLSGSLLYEDVAGGKKWFVLPLPHTQWFASKPPIRMMVEQTTEYPMESNPLTANTLRLCKLNLTRHRLHCSKSFQHSWTHQTDLLPNSSESLSLPKHFRHPVFSPVCSCLHCLWNEAAPSTGGTL